MNEEYQDAETREQDRFLPIANISRIMKKALPPNAKISKDAKECVQECVSEFISFITSEACEKCLSERRKTINGDDLLHAMTTLGFEKYIDPLRLYLQRYREVTKTDKPEDASIPPIAYSDIKTKNESDSEEEVDKSI
jgi:Histones H3 and H4